MTLDQKKTVITMEQEGDWTVGDCINALRMVADEMERESVGLDS